MLYLKQHGSLFLSFLTFSQDFCDKLLSETKNWLRISIVCIRYLEFVSVYVSF